MAEENPTPENQPAPPVVKGPPPIASARWSKPKTAQEFADVLAWRIKKGKSKSASDLLEQMFNYVKNNPYSDFPTGR